MTRRKPALKSWPILTVLVVIAFASQGINRLMNAFLPSDAPAAPRYLFMMAKSVLLYGLPAFSYIFLARGIPMPALMEKRQLKAKPLLLVSLMAILHQCALTLLTGLFFLNSPTLAPPLVPAPANAFDFVLAMIALCVLPAIFEESLFRRGVFPSLQREFSDLTAILATAFLFALMHSQPASFPAHFFAGFILTYLCFETRSLIYPVVYHFIFNLVSLIIAVNPFLGGLFSSILPAAMLTAAIICLLLFLGLAPFWLLREPRRKLIARKASLGAVLLLCAAFILLLPSYILPLLS